MSSDIDKTKSEYGKALLTGEHIPQSTDSAVKLLEKAVKLKNSNAKRFLALEYISGEHLEQDIEKGIALLTECADSGDVYNVPLVKTQMKKIIVTAKTLYSHPKNVSKIYAALHTDLAW